MSATAVVEVIPAHALRLLAAMFKTMPKVVLYNLPRGTIADLASVALTDADEWTVADSDQAAVLNMVACLGLVRVVQNLHPHVKLDRAYWANSLRTVQSGARVSPADRVAMLREIARRAAHAGRPTEEDVVASKWFLMQCPPSPHVVTIMRAFLPTAGLEQYAKGGKLGTMYGHVLAELRRRAFLCPRRCLWAFAVAGACTILAEARTQPR
jgi:hypothetical protein